MADRSIDPAAPLPSKSPARIVRRGATAPYPRGFQLARLRPRRLPVWSPLLVLLGFIPIAVNLDLLPGGAILLLCGLSPLSRPAPRCGHRPAER